MWEWTWHAVFSGSQLSGLLVCLSVYFLHPSRGGSWRFLIRWRGTARLCLSPHKMKMAAVAAGPGFPCGHSKDEEAAATRSPARPPTGLPVLLKEEQELAPRLAPSVLRGLLCAGRQHRSAGTAVQLESRRPGACFRQAFSVAVSQLSTSPDCGTWTLGGLPPSSGVHFSCRREVREAVSFLGNRMRSLCPVWILCGPLSEACGH